MQLTIILDNSRAVLVAFIPLLQGAIYTILVALSTTARILSRFLEDLGRSVIKSMEISLHFVFTIWVDYSLPFDNVWSDFSM